MVNTGTTASPVFVSEYYLKDHLGNTRVSFLGKTLPGNAIEITGKTDYYPFGLAMSQYSTNIGSDYSKNKYLYNGKEIQDDKLNGTFFGWLDYGARFYDPQIGRWHSVDVNADDYFAYSPYCYVLNNPIICVDPDGKDVINADIERLNKADDKRKKAQQARDNAKTKKEEKKTQRKLDRATNQYNKAYSAYMQTEKAITDLALNDPATFDQLNNLSYVINGKKTTVDVYISSSDKLTNFKEGAHTGWALDEKRNAIYSTIPGTNDKQYNIFALNIEPGISGGDIKIAHEEGHMLDILKRPKYYWDKKGTWTEMDCRNPTKEQLEFAKPANDLEYHYIDIRKKK